MYIAHTSNNLFFSSVDSGYAVFALSSRDKTNCSTETSRLYCYNGTIKEKNSILKLLFVLCVHVCRCWWWSFFSVVMVVWVFFQTDGDRRCHI